MSAGFSEEDEARLLQLLRQQNNVEGLVDFINRVSPTLPPPPHIDVLINLFERTRHEEVRAVVSMPPGFAKSITAMHGLAWRTFVDPACKNAYLSFGAELAKEHSREVRRMALEAGVELREDAKNMSAWQTKQGGAFYAQGVGGALTGKRLSGVAVADDLIKDMVEANSISTREKIWAWFQSVLSTRLLPGASVIVIATRWHYDDIIGRLRKMDGMQWEEINLPAVHDGNLNALDDMDDERAVSLWPALYDMEHLKAKRVMSGEYTWSALFQGNPVPRGAAIFDSVPARFDLDSFKIDGHKIVIAVDPAATASTKADYSVAAVCAMKGEGENARMWILDVLRCQVTIPELVRKLLDLQNKWKAPMAVEAVGAFKAIPDMLKEADPNLRLLPVQLRGDKFTRAQPYAGAWNAGRVYIPQDTLWADLWISEHALFTGAGDINDDQVDAGAHAFTALYRSRAAVRTSFRADFLPFG
ncbi:MAG: hypothetical protein GY814_04080 [Gammaproteobacteria bacterium]|nr:hypothetical protein [Gammaproteobacteria bacterium]